ncbi:MAG: hypothetical protein GY862_30450 [Gammaproteobacteria bacterium]|nr:hypothetical protein [Gammaproteobacteria bacterium]
MNTRKVLSILRHAGLEVKSHNIIADSRTRRVPFRAKQMNNRNGWVCTHLKPQGWLINYGNRLGRLGCIKTWAVDGL